MISRINSKVSEPYEQLKSMHMSWPLTRAPDGSSHVACGNVDYARYSDVEI